MSQNGSSKLFNIGDEATCSRCRREFSVTRELQCAWCGEKMSAETLSKNRQSTKIKARNFGVGFLIFVFLNVALIAILYERKFIDILRGGHGNWADKAGAVFAVLVGGPLIQLVFLGVVYACLRLIQEKDKSDR